MTYDFFCYKPLTDKPNVKEARRILEAGKNFPVLKRALDPETKWRIASALLREDGNLEAERLEKTKLAAMAYSSEEKAKFDGIMLLKSSTRVSMELDIADDRVFIMIPYWFEGRDADRVFAVTATYLLAIRRAAGFFVYDPQAPAAFDPAEIALGERKFDSPRDIYGDTMKVLLRVLGVIRKEGKDPKPDETGQPDDFSS